METKDAISDVNVRISKVKAQLKPLLEEKKHLMEKQSEELGCTCGVIINNYEAMRLMNIYCPYHYPEGWY